MKKRPRIEDYYDWEKEITRVKLSWFKRLAGMLPSLAAEYKFDRNVWRSKAIYVKGTPNDVMNALELLPEIKFTRETGRYHINFVYRGVVFCASHVSICNWVIDMVEGTLYLAAYFDILTSAELEELFPMAGR